MRLPLFYLCAPCSPMGVPTAPEESPVSSDTERERAFPWRLAVAFAWAAQASAQAAGAAPGQSAAPAGTNALSTSIVRKRGVSS